MLKWYGRINTWMALTFIFHIAAILAFEGDAKGLNPMTSFQETWSPRLEINLRGAYYGKESLLDPENFHLSGNATARLSREVTTNMMFYIDPRINFEPLYTKGVEFFIEDQEERPAFTLNEIFLSWYGDSVELEMGKRIYSWKVADVFSPVDNLNPVDIIYPMDSEKIGVPSISVLKIFKSLQVQVVWLPFFVPDRQPDHSNRWQGDDPEARADFEEKFGMQPVLVDAGRALDDNKLDKMSMASRISSSTLLSGWDLAFIYRYGYSSRGVIRNDIDLPSLPMVYQTSEYPAYNLYGLSFSSTLGDVEIHGEGTFHDSRDNLKDEDYLSYILGLNYINYNCLTQWFEEIRFVAEYAGERITKKRETGNTYSDKGVSRGLTANIIGSIEFKINEEHSVKSVLIYNVKDDDSALDLNGTSQLNDHLELTYGYQQFSGNETSFFGQWSRNNRVYVNLSLKY